MQAGPLAPEAVIRHAYLVARRIVPPELAHDVAQEAWIKYQTQLEKDGPDWPERRARAWIWSVASNTARSLLRKKRPQCGLEPEQLDGMPAGPDVADRAAEREQASLRKQLAWSILAGLPRRDRELLTLRLLEGRSWKEIAEILVENSRTLRSRYSRLIARLKTRLVPCISTPPEEGPHV